MDAWTNEWTNEWTNVPMNGPMNGRRWMNLGERSGRDGATPGRGTGPRARSAHLQLQLSLRRRRVVVDDEEDDVDDEDDDVDDLFSTVV